MGSRASVLRTTMKAAVVHAFGSPPVWEEFPEPTPNADEVLVRVTAAAVNPLVLSRASGAHYSAGHDLPFVPGVDGVGRTSDGRRVYFRAPRPPYGALAEHVPVQAARTLPVPDGVPDVTAAVAAIPGVSGWIPLTRLAPLRPGEAVLVNGATGSAGRMAVQVARHLGAPAVIATGRDPTAFPSLTAIGATATVALAGPTEQWTDQVKRLVREHHVGVVLDYLWGPSAEGILAALGGPDAPRGSSRIRYVTVGAITGEAISLRSALLRSSGIELVGSGIGSTPDQEIVAGTREFLDALGTGHFQVDYEPQPFASVQKNWGRTGGGRRLVFVPS